MQIHRGIELKMSDRYLIICPNVNNDIISSLNKQITQDDELIITTIPKFPSRFLEKIYFNAKKKFEWLILINNNSMYISDDFLLTIKKDKVYDGIIIRRTDDLQSGQGIEVMSNKLTSDDDSICIPIPLFRGFRDVVPTTTLSGIIKLLSRSYKTYVDVSRGLVGYNDIIKEKRKLDDEIRKSELENKHNKDKIYEKDILKRKKAIEIFWQEELKKKKQYEEMLMRTIPSAVKKINKNGSTNIVSGVDKLDKQTVSVGDWNNWMTIEL